MKSVNYGLDLLVPSQMNKELLINENISTLDAFCSSSVTAFIGENLPKAEISEKYVLNQGPKKCSIAYCIDQAEGWRFLSPKKGMVIFVRKEDSFFIFDSLKWEKIGLNLFPGQKDISESKTFSEPASGSTDFMDETTKFSSISGQFDAPESSEYLYLYLNGDTEISLDELKLKKCLLVLKQNYQKTFKLKFKYNILWQDKKPYQITQTPNVMEIISFHRLPETKYFIGSVIAQNCSY